MCKNRIDQLLSSPLMYIPIKPHIYFCGIGGVGMSGIARVLNNLGYIVKGSNNVENNYTKSLKEIGIDIIIGHDKAFIKDAQVMVVSSAIPKDNEEIIEAKRLGIPVIERVEMLAELMRLKKSIVIAGSHGKTTITSMAGALMYEAKKDPTIINGGILNAYNSNAKMGMGEWIVAESDESDGSFQKLSPTIAIISNIDYEHMDHYKDISDVIKAFECFIQKIPFYGLLILCADHPLASNINTYGKRVLTYGIESHQANIRAVNIKLSTEGAFFDVIISNPPIDKEGIIPIPSKIKDLFIPMVGEHNILNSLSVVALALEMNISEEVLKQGMKNFKGVKRRFTTVGKINDITIVDDYAHHPVEILATLKAAKQVQNFGRIVTLFEPHKFSRLEGLFEEFSDAFMLSDLYGVF